MISRAFISEVAVLLGGGHRQAEGLGARIGAETFSPVSAGARRVRRLQAWDRYAGVPGCWFLTLVRRARDLLPSTRAKARSLVFLKLAEQGATVLAADVIRAATDRLGREQVWIVVLEENRPILDALGLVAPERILTIRTENAWNLLRTVTRCLWTLRRHGVDACVDLEFLARSTAVIGFLCGARWRSGLHAAMGPRRGDLLTHRVPYDSRRHAAEDFRALWRALDDVLVNAPGPERVSGPLRRGAVTDADRQAVDGLLARLGVAEGQRLILLNANAGDLIPQRRWDPRNYVVLACRLLMEFPQVLIAFTGAPGEERAVERLVQTIGSPRCVSVAGQTTLPQLLALYERAEVLVTNDSGPAHFATLTPIDTVVLFGPEAPSRFAGPGARTHPLWAGLPCSPCVSPLRQRATTCGDNVCLRRITVDQVFDLTCGLFRQRLRVRW